MEIVENRAITLKLKNPARVLDHVHNSGAIGEHEVAVKWGIPEAMVLRNMGIKVPSPILGRYNWPGRYKPFDHQRTTAAFLTLHRRAFCFNEQGTGKTGAAAWAADFLMREGLISRVLVICPMSIMDSAWRADLFSFVPHRSADVAYGAAKKRKAVIQSGVEFVIINYDGLKVVQDDLKAGGFDLIIVDEGTHYKNVSTDRWKTLYNLLGPDTWLWLMTGTPAAQGPLDAFGLARLVNPRGVPRYKGEWQNMVEYKVSRFRWLPKKNATEIVHNALQPAIRFTKEECLDLPELVYVKRNVELTKQQKLYYEKLRKEMLMQAADEAVTAKTAAVNTNKLLQISGGAVYTDDHNVLEFDISSRYNVLKEVIAETSQKVLIFVPYAHSIKILHDKLTADGHSTAVISGKVSAGERTRIFNAFQTTNEPEILVIQPQAAAHGVTLTAADTIVWWSPVPSLETYAQANARIHRSGQVHRCTVVQLQGSAIEKHIYELLDGKISLHTKVTDLYQQIIGKSAT